MGNDFSQPREYPLFLKLPPGTKEGLDLILAPIPVDSLREHESISEEHVRELAKDIRLRGLMRPIVIDAGSGTILDGHHRFSAFRRLGRKAIPALLLDYFDPRVVLESRAGVTKEQVVRRAAEGNRYPQKTTKHSIRISSGLIHVSEILDHIERGDSNGS
jgi:hypothetical protein